MRAVWMPIAVFCGAISCAAFGQASTATDLVSHGVSAIQQPAEPATKLADSVLITHDDRSLDADIRESLNAPALPAEMLTQPDESLERALPVPEPTSVALLGGLGALLILVHRLRIYFDRSASR